MRIFIGWDSREAECAVVLAASLRQHSSIPLDITFLKLAELNFDRPHDPLQSTEFTYTRFLVPALCEFHGKAVFMDCDMLCLGDIRELDELSMDDFALRVVKHDHRPTQETKMDGRPQTSYPRKNWSSLMLMNCERLALWTRETVARESGAFLHRFQGIDDALIGDLPTTWNTLDWMDSTTKLIHYTSGGPWFDECRDHPYGAAWFDARDQLRKPG